MARGPLVIPTSRAPSPYIDLLVLGDPEMSQLLRVLREGEHRPRLEVNAMVRSTADWESDESSFKEQLDVSFKVAVVGELPRLRSS